MRKGDLLICTELSRLGRNMLMIMGILNRCSQNGVSIQTIKDNFTLSDNINSKIIAFAFALAAEIERNLISQRTREALAVKRMEGVRLGRPPGSSQKKLTFIKEYDNISALLAQGESVSKIAKSTEFTAILCGNTCLKCKKYTKVKFLLNLMFNMPLMNTAYNS